MNHRMRARLAPRLAGLFGAALITSLALISFAPSVAAISTNGDDDPGLRVASCQGTDSHGGHFEHWVVSDNTHGEHSFDSTSGSDVWLGNDGGQSHADNQDGEHHHNFTPEQTACATVTFAKVVSNQWNGTAGPGDFTLTLTPSAPDLSTISGTDGQTVDVVPGSYALGENPVAGYELDAGAANGCVKNHHIEPSSLTHSDSSEPTQTPTFEEGESWTCTLHNQDLPANQGSVDIVKEASQPEGQPEGSVGFTITVTNNYPGEGPDANGHVLDSLPSGFDWHLEYTSQDNDLYWDCQITDSTLDCTFDDLDPAESVSLTLIGVPSEGSSVCGRISNTASLQDVVDAYSEGQQSLTTNESSTAAADTGISCDQSTPPPTPYLTIAKTNGTGGAEVAPGTAVNFTLTFGVFNTASFAGVGVVDQLPAGIGSASGISNGGTYDAGTNRITWSGLTISSGSTLTYTATVSNSAAAGEYTNVATVSNCGSPSTCSASSKVEVKAAEPTGSAEASGGVKGVTATPRITLPPTSTVDGQPSGTSGNGLGLILIVLAAVMTTLGYAATLPGRRRRRLE